MGFELFSLLFKKENLHRTAVHIYVLAAITAPFAVMTGLLAEDAAHIHHYILERHEKMAFVTVWTSWLSLFVLWIVSKKSPQNFRIIFLISVLLVSAVVTLTGYYGGRLVYEYGVGVEQ
jgi:uncharacterized membrane protein